ncbi:MAG: PH domain-containing protein [Candidatus Altiarchaeota archaeon]
MGLLKLSDGEKLLLEARPHPLSFWDMYAAWVWVIVLSFAFLMYGQEFEYIAGGPLVAAAGTVRHVGSILPGFLRPVSDAANWGEWFTRTYTPVAAWIAALLLSSVAVSVVRIEFKWVWFMAGVGLASVGLSAYWRMPAESAYNFGMLLSLVGFGVVDAYRRSHIFYITDQRIVTEVRFGGVKRNELSYDKINNVVLEQGLIGSLFNFGTIIPVTASGLGMGSDFSSVSMGSQGSVAGIPLSAQVTGGRAVQIPRIRSMYGLFGVEDPERVQEMVSVLLRSYVQAPYLRKMTDQLDDIRKKMR